MNQVNLIGRISQDIEFKQVNGQNGMFEVAKFNIAVRENANEAYFFVCEAFNKLASNIATYCQKGSHVAISGKLKNETYTDNNNQKRTVTKILVNQIEFLSKSENINQEVQPQQQPQYNPNVYPPLQPNPQAQYQPQQNQYNPTYTQPQYQPAQINEERLNQLKQQNQQAQTPNYSMEDLNNTFNVPYGKLPF